MLHFSVALKTWIRLWTSHLSPRSLLRGTFLGCLWGFSYVLHKNDENSHQKRVCATFFLSSLFYSSYNRIIIRSMRCHITGNFIHKTVCVCVQRQSIPCDGIWWCLDSECVGDTCVSRPAQYNVLSLHTHCSNWGKI